MKAPIPRYLILLVAAVLSVIATASFNSPAQAQFTEVDEVYIVPYLIPLDANGERIVTVKANQHVVLGARWGACTPGLALAFAQGAVVYYEIDGMPLPSSSIEDRGYWDWPVPVVSDQGNSCMNKTDTGWFVFWRYDYGAMPIGVHSGYLHYSRHQQFIDGGDYDQDGRPDKHTIDGEVLFTIVVVE